MPRDFALQCYSFLQCSVIGACFLHCNIPVSTAALRELVQCSGVECSGVECSGVEYSGVGVECL